MSKPYLESNVAANASVVQRSSDDEELDTSLLQVDSDTHARVDDHAVEHALLPVHGIGYVVPRPDAAHGPLFVVFTAEAYQATVALFTF